MNSKTVLVTCGATIPFPKLISCILSPEFIRSLIDNGFNRLIVQFGRGYGLLFGKQLGLLKPSEEKLSSLTSCQLGSDQVCCFKIDNLEIVGMEYSTRIQELIKDSADLVISHAGTGSILDSLRLHKPLIVVINEDLMDNHQQQIADKFEELGYVWSCKPQTSRLIDCLDKSQRKNTELVPLPNAHNKNFENTLINLANS
ncbi:hypothetical protein KAFR_0F03110 [Kazachstania africana CBS 2517]|uniref:UDP-N-acetylglucosamine transferase subunit ALG13 n=1 Tax=Kazachstania africana (strain ATCC 22294 / BCRC 22015 / CBS 2517 / CECT 1963 / NBRC 1671 / NRRL Y-8276) TaxID=1071382 RepID=H2AX07_KAZAF|nr:hypothetical protein KAFR_0F03110 [Kazachstania africana CBS 2517]CCF58907.1 hypothetical protein KAFR_0F03110 [Kazachstania africana CBS 2517]